MGPRPACRRPRLARNPGTELTVVDQATSSIGKLRPYTSSFFQNQLQPPPSAQPQSQASPSPILLLSLSLRLDCGSLLPLAVSAACCGENFHGEGQIVTQQNSPAIYELRPSWSGLRFGPHPLVVCFGSRTPEAFSHLAGDVSPRSRITAGCDTQSGSRLPQSKFGPSSKADISDRFTRGIAFSATQAPTPEIRAECRQSALRETNCSFTTKCKQSCR